MSIYAHVEFKNNDGANRANNLQKERRVMMMMMNKHVNNYGISQRLNLLFIQGPAEGLDG